MIRNSHPGVSGPTANDYVAISFAYLRLATLNFVSMRQLKNKIINA